MGWVISSGTNTAPRPNGEKRFLIAETQELDEEYVYGKERRLVEEVKVELAPGRRRQIMWNLSMTKLQGSSFYWNQFRQCRCRPRFSVE